jgi:D-erythro-7,8-dihydroneopterin triphosphate epimerase
MIIKLKNLRILAYIGAHEWEQKRKQELIINMKLAFDGEKVIKTDALRDAIDYEELRNKILKEVTQSKYTLIEHLAGRIMKVTLSDERIKEVWLEIDKPEALQYCDSVSVSYYCKQNDCS